jgi:hypothetical protein
VISSSFCRVGCALAFFVAVRLVCQLIRSQRGWCCLMCNVDSTLHVKPHCPPFPGYNYKIVSCNPMVGRMRGGTTNPRGPRPRLSTNVVAAFFCVWGRGELMIAIVDIN